MLTVGRSHLRNTVTSTVKIVFPIFIRQHWVVNERRIYDNLIRMDLLRLGFSYSIYSRSSNDDCCSQ